MYSMERRRRACGIGAGLLVASGVHAQTTPFVVGQATDDVWAYISAISPSTNTVLSVWGLPPNDLNPGGFPGVPGGPPNGANFYSHAFVGWRLPGNLPANFRWGGATITVTLASDTWRPQQADTFLRFLSRGFDEATWNISSNTPTPVSALGRITGADANAMTQGDTITYTIPGAVNPAIFRPWFTGGQVYLAITADGSPAPPSQPGQPPDLTGALQIFSHEDIFGRGPVLTLIPGKLGDCNGDGRVDFTDLSLVISAYGQTGNALPGDGTSDGVVNFTDLSEVVGNFGT